MEIDVQEMDVGDTVSLSEIKLPEGVEITILQQDEDRDQAVVSVTETREMIIEEEEEELGLEEGVEGVEGEEGEEGDTEATEGTEEDSETPTEGKESDPSGEKQKE